jgi:glucose/arabinose dehydrogenase
VRYVTGDYYARAMTRLFVALAAGLLCAPAAHAAVELSEIPATPRPIYVAAAPADVTRLFVLQHDGAIRLIRNGELLERPFLDLTPRVQTGGFRGLLSMAFAPDYERSRRFYVFFTDRFDRSRVEEYRRSRGNPNVARPSSRRTLLKFRLPDIPETDSPHLGGQVEMGPDGLLYISTGDGSRGFKDSRLTRAAHNRRSLLGKLLRIDPVDSRRRYRIPRSNPYAGRTPGRGEIFARGLRNPWRFSFDASTIALADDGEDRLEEINLLSIGRARGADFGWPAFEGSRRLSDDARRRDMTPPAFEYPHRSDTFYGDGCTGGVIGGYVVRDPTVPSLDGRYLYGDYCFQELRSFDPRDPEGTDRLELKDTSFPFSLGRDARGHVYVVLQDARVARIVETDG